MVLRMKKILSIVMMLVLTLSLAACGRNAGNEDTSTDVEVSKENGTDSESDVQTGDSEDSGKVLVAYFSWSGNTEEMASYIAEQTGGELFEIQPETPYPTDYDECSEVAKEERDQNERPSILNLPESVAEYDTILIGYPIWWHTAPMIIGTFLENYDLNGVDVYPFTQSASMDEEQFSNSVEFVQENTDGGNVYDGLFARPSDTETIDTYLSDHGLVQ